MGLGQMNCFEWHARSSDFLDGTLPEEFKQAAEGHVDSCKECNERHKHYRLLLSAISGQPRSTLPVPIRKAPLTATLPRLDMAAVGRSRWESLPWYVRTTAEATGIVFLILSAIIVAPKLRILYEKGREARLTEFTDLFRRRDDGEAELLLAQNIPAARGKMTSEHGSHASDFETEGGDDEAYEELIEESNERVEVLGDDGSTIRVGNSEIWRFTLKADSPAELRPKIVEILTSLRIPSSTPGLGGIEAPGGIQFDLLLPKSAVPHIKTRLQKLAPKAPLDLSNTPAAETFTWYKTRSRRPITQGRTRVVIWLSKQM
jgi:hypothetical protein